MERKKIVKKSYFPEAEKNSKILLSILIPTLFTRRKVFNEITEKLMKQIEENNFQNLVEIIAHFDNKTIGLARKRNNMLKTASGKFISNLDDDDDIGNTYIKDIIDCIIKNPDTDVITFKQHCNCDGKEFYVESGLEYELNMNRKENNTFFRYPWIWCVWRKSKVNNIEFKDPGDKKNFEEDYYWLKKIIESNNIKKEVKIKKILHFYKFNSNLTETQG